MPGCIPCGGPLSPAWRTLALGLLVGALAACAVTPLPREAARPDPEDYTLADVFVPYYGREGFDKDRVLGAPVSALVTVRTGSRLYAAQYFEKGRLEDHGDETGDPSLRFQFGLLVDELQRARSPLPIGGDPSSVTYARIHQLAQEDRRIAPPPNFVGHPHKNDDGSIFIPYSAALERAPGYNVSPYFWSYLERIEPPGWLQEIGLPMTAPELAVVTKGKRGDREIVIQAFQRAILTYDPLNEPDFQVERANVGTDYVWSGLARAPTVRQPSPLDPSTLPGLAELTGWQRLAVIGVILLLVVVLAAAMPQIILGQWPAAGRPVRPYRIGRYRASLVATAPLLHAVAAAVTVGAYLWPPSVWPLEWFDWSDPLAVVVGVVAAVLAWLAAAWFYARYATVELQQPVSYGELSARVDSLNGALTHVEQGSLGTALERSAGTVARCHTIAVARLVDQQVGGLGEPVLPPGVTRTGMTSCDALQWVSGWGYIHAWKTVHQAEEALILVAPTSAVVAGAAADSWRLQGNQITNAETLRTVLRVAVAQLSPTTGGLYLAPPALVTAAISATPPAVAVNVNGAPAALAPAGTLAAAVRAAVTNTVAAITASANAAGTPPGAGQSKNPGAGTSQGGPSANGGGGGPGLATVVPHPGWRPVPP